MAISGIKISGVNGGNCLLSSMAALRVERGMIDGAQIKVNKDGYNVYFVGNSAEWNEEQLVLSSASQPYECRVFKSLDDAMSAIQEIGLKKETIQIIDSK